MLPDTNKLEPEVVLQTKVVDLGLSEHFQQQISKKPKYRIKQLGKNARTEDPVVLAIVLHLMH